MLMTQQKFDFDNSDVASDGVVVCPLPDVFIPTKEYPAVYLASIVNNRVSRYLPVHMYTAKIRFHGVIVEGYDIHSPIAAYEDALSRALGLYDLMLGV